MQKLKLSIAALTLLLATACNNANSDSATTAEKQEVANQTGKEYVTDNGASVIKWTATHKGGFAPRFGTLSLSNGNITAENGVITGGSLTIDMNSLTVDPASVTEADKKAMDLQNHLKSPDFFEVEKYAHSKFDITSVTPFDAAKDKSLMEGANYMVSGNFDVKGKSVNITFPAKITTTDNNISVEAKFTVDRTVWNLNFGTEGNPADWGVSKDFEVAFNVVANAK